MAACWFAFDRPASSPAAIKILPNGRTVTGLGYPSPDRPFWEGLSAPFLLLVAEANRLTVILRNLQKFYGRPVPPKITDPLELILFENVAYLADDDKRRAAFAALKKKIGTRPGEILKASQKQLEEITRIGGIVPELRAQRLRQIAELAHYVFKDDLAAELTKPLPQARKALKKFPTIGDPGAEKILMLTRSYPVLALESNGLRVLLRLGFADEKKSYAASYRGVQQALAAQLPSGYDSLISAHQLLRQHGQELCKRTRPLCDAGCPLTAGCRYYRSLSPAE
jgi:endonuclease III